MDLFNEEIKIRKTWVGGLVLTSILISTIVIVVSLFAGKENNNSTLFIVGITIVEGSLFLLFITAKLKVNIDLVGIGYQWFPLMLRPKSINWDLVEYAWVRKSNSLKEYGGWGIKGTRKNRAINVSGNTGLQIVLSDERRIFIETQNPDELKNVLGKLALKGIRGMNQQPNE